MLDSDEHIFCLLPDNKTIASEEQIVADHDLMKRTHTYGVLSPHDRFTDEASASHHYYEGKRQGEQPHLTKHKMNFQLRPGEALIWMWDLSNLLHGSKSGFGNQRWRLTDHVMNGCLEYSPDLSDPATINYLITSNITQKTDGPLGPGLYTEKDTGIINVPVSVPYPIVGGKLTIRFGLSNRNAEDLETSVSFDKGLTWQEVYTTTDFDFTRIVLDLNGLFHHKYLNPNDKEGYYDPPSEEARYEYLLRLRLISKAGTPTISLKSFRLNSTLQMAQLAMPELKLGTNEFIYTDESSDPTKVKITHSWQECKKAKVPGKPAGAIYPEVGNTAMGSQFTIKWKPPSGKTPIDDYEFELSEYDDMRWKLSPNFHRLINRTPQRNTTSFTIPYKGLLNPVKKYYWRVRARSQRGIWGPWSDIYSFKVQCPAVPIEPQANFDRETRVATLIWKQGKTGTRPVHFKIYGSNERGFTASDTANRYDSGIDGIKTSPTNLVYETDGPSTVWLIPSDLWYPYYRIVAVDSEGIQSGTSVLTELEHPLIITDSLPRALINKDYFAEIRRSFSIGHLVAATQDREPCPKQFLSGDKHIMEVSGLPKGLRVDLNSGLLNGIPLADAIGEYMVRIMIKSQNNGKMDTKVYKLTVASH